MWLNTLLMPQLTLLCSGFPFSLGASTAHAQWRCGLGAKGASRCFSASCLYLPHALSIPPLTLAPQ